MDQHNDDDFYNAEDNDGDSTPRENRSRNSLAGSGSGSGSNDSSYRVSNNKVVFYVGGDSTTTSTSECESGSTGRSGNRAAGPQGCANDDNLPQEHDEPVAHCSNANPWHKYHFQGGSTSREVEIDAASADTDCSDDNEADLSEHGVSHSNTIGMIPTSPDISLPHLSYTNSDDSYQINGIAGERNLQRCWGKRRILVACAIVQFFSALMVSLHAPFFPAEAEKKGATASSYGFVFAAFELTVFILAPFYGLKINQWSPKLIFIFGIFTAAVSSIIFGVLDKIENVQFFIAACVLVRVWEAVGESAVVTSSFIIVASTFPDTVASTSGILETFYGVGLVSGPIVGSFLYQIGGYPLPFMVNGGALFVSAILTCIILPSSEQISQFQINDSPVVVSSYKSFRLLGSVSVLVSAICIVIGAMSISFLQVTLEPHLRQFNLSQLSIGSIIIINGAVYTMLTPFWGILCEKVLQLKLVAFCGAAILICGFSLVGPVPIFKFKQELWIIALGLALQGLGLGALLTASFVSILRSATPIDHIETPSTHGRVSSLWTSMFSLGSFLGPSLSGILYDTIGFTDGTIVIIALCLIMMCVLILFVCCSETEMNTFNLSENEPLLNASVPESASVYSQHSRNVPAAVVNRAAPQQNPRTSYGTT